MGRALGVNLQLVAGGQGGCCVRHVGAAHPRALRTAFALLRHRVKVGGARASAALDDALGDFVQRGMQGGVHVRDLQAIQTCTVQAGWFNNREMGRAGLDAWVASS